RADWFLLDSRRVRHAAVGLFCCGLCLYLTGKRRIPPKIPALSMYMLLLFEPEAGIASACILTSGILVLLLTVIHALLRASQTSRRSRSRFSQALYENDSARRRESSGGDLDAAPPRSRPQIHREFSFPPLPERKSR
ncbi:TM221 protein, partial [Ptilonorhynchus violaceus]|nr:TM221 protein [Ptilonorhynchus violaceus]